MAPLLALVVMGTVDVANYGAAKLKIQQAVNRGLEMAMMGGPNTAATDIRDQAAAQAGVSSDQVSVTQTLECSGTVTSWSSSCTSSQETARFLQIQVSSTFTPSFPLSKLAISSSGTLAISATGVIRVQ